MLFSILYTVIVLALLRCTVSARRSNKGIGRFVALLDSAFIPPVIGNLIIITTYEENAARLGYYFYFLGMNLVMYALCRFTYAYCKGIGTKHNTPRIVYLALTADSVQMLLNTVFGHAFDVEPIDFEGMIYYRLVPHLGQTVHRIVDYSIFAAIILIYVLIITKTPRIYREKFTVLLVSMLAIAVWQTVYIFSRTPVDRSMIGYGVMGILIYFFAIKYRPLRFLDRMLSDIVSEMPDALFVMSPEGNCMWANSEGRKFAGVKGSNYEDTSQFLLGMFGESIKEKGSWTRKATIGEGDDAKYYILRGESVTDDHGHTSGMYLRITDNTEEQRRILREMKEMGHDRLTGLYTWDRLYKGIETVLKENPDVAFNVIFVDVRNFKIVNDVFGNEFGDFAIKTIANWIRSHKCDKYVYGRLVGDTFGICMPCDSFDPEVYEEELKHFKVRQMTIEHQLLIHLGVYEVNERNLDVSVMLDRAHLALGPIRDDYHTHVAYYDDKLRSKLLWNQEISAQLRDALENGEIQPYLQPIADADGRIIGAEALARWIHPEKGFLSPAAFIPIFEENGMIVEVDKHIWRKTCEILSRWEEEGRNMFISVNISPKDFYFTNVYANIMELVMEYGIDQSKLRIEITETAMMGDSDSTRLELLKDFRESGFTVEMDDFGSGYSSLNMLKDIPVDILKIDMKFLSETEEKGRAEIILKNVVKMSQELGLVALTEGVETKEQFDMLSSMGCKLFQGYYFAKPIAVSEFENKYQKKDTILMGGEE
ncbi:MAG: EAL domain-containing protein [Lachnospiraceae bacterium]|nr:EAL domain-containing protein [Lachnospiraceae bacterium]